MWRPGPDISTLTLDSAVSTSLKPNVFTIRIKGFCISSIDKTPALSYRVIEQISTFFCKTVLL